METIVESILDCINILRLKLLSSKCAQLKASIKTAYSRAFSMLADNTSGPIPMPISSTALQSVSIGLLYLLNPNMRESKGFFSFPSVYSSSKKMNESVSSDSNALNRCSLFMTLISIEY